MKIQDLLQKNAIITDLTGKSKNEILTDMAGYLASLYGLPNSEDISRRIIEREVDISTGIGFGIAIPHARIQGIDRLYLIAGRSKPGIEFNAIDEQPVHLLFMMISPRNTSSEHTQILSKLSQIMAYEDVRTKLMQVKTAEQFLTVIIKSENKYVDA